MAGPSPIGAVLLRRCRDKRDDLLPTRHLLADVPYVIRRPCPLAGDSLGLVSGGVLFPKLSKLLNQEDALGVPCLDTVIHALRRRVLAGCCGQASSVTSISHYGLLHRTSGWQALMLSRWWAADARVERMGARPNRAVVIKTALTCDSYSNSSTVLGWRRERVKNSLVTAIERLLVKQI
jgi:hypothetical protein